MQKNFSSWSRAGKPILFEDLSRKEAMNFLMNGVFMERVDGDRDVTSSKMHRDMASRIFDIVGGRLIHLIAFKRNFFTGIPFDQTLQQLKNQEREKFVIVSQNPSQWKVINELRESPQKALKLSKVIKVTSLEDVHTLLETKVLRYQRSSAGAVLKFFSPLTEHVVFEMEEHYQQQEVPHQTNVVKKASSSQADLVLGAISTMVLFALFFMCSPSH